MEKIYQHVEDIVTVAELQDGFYEVEVTVLVRRSGGSESDFIRMQLESYDGVRISEHCDRPFRLIVTGHFANA